MSLVARGLILDEEARLVAATPFPKFFNYGENGTIPPDEPFVVTEKLDGSLGIIFFHNGRWRCATKGSFYSEQAKWAEAALVDRSHALVEGWTYLAEIIYPENRIVLDYGDRAGLVLLAALSTSTGHHIGPGWDGDGGAWPAEVVTVYGDADDVTTVDPNDRPNAEGYVVLSGDRLTRVKLKADEYMRLHKILTGVSNVTVWELLRNGDDLSTLYDKVPDEFAAWAKSTVADLDAAYNSVLADARKVYDRIAHLLPDRKAFAAEAVQSDHRSILFALADDKPVAPLIWKQIKPERALPFTVDADQ